ncbi:MAG TPA: transporter substrate-binding domain-containing protein [Burkholderiaceae bacterium]|jgi:polar amino acid transport system substrate-binding protein|nr:transporter substrate-binding domain-containing protein [Burkholderiaceae bacterium]
MERWGQVFIFCVIWLMACLCHANPVITISTLFETDPATTVATRILSDAYAKLGITLKVVVMPGERSLISANSGVTDGELYRKGDLMNLYPNLRLVPIPIMHYEIVAFCRCKPFTVDGWGSLKAYRIGYIRGIKIVEQNTVGMNTEPVGTLEQAFGKLELGRSDIVLANRATGIALLRTQQWNDVIVLQPALATFPVYHYLSRNHEELVPKLTEVLRQMEKNGSMERIQREMLSGY